MAGAGPGPGPVETVQGLFATPATQLLGTLLAVVAYLVVVELLRRAGSVLKRRLDGTVVEAGQATVLALATALLGAGLVVVWRATPQLLLLAEVLDVSRAEVVKLVITAIVLGIAYALTRLTKRAIHRIPRGYAAVSEHHQQIAHHLVQVGVYVLAVAAVLGLWRVNVQGLLVGAGFLGIVLGLAARQTLGAVLAGFVVLFSRPFELGDWVVVGDREGVVTDITVVNTQLRTLDDEVVMIPNDVVTASEVVNRSRTGRLRLEQDVGVDYDADLERAMATAERAMAGLDELMDVPEPHAVLAEFGDSAVVLRLRFYIAEPSARKAWRARSAVVRSVRAAFEEAGVKIPFPQRELLGREEEGGLRLADVRTLADREAPQSPENRRTDEGNPDGEGTDGP